MFDLVPFKKGGNDISNIFDEMEKRFMHSFGDQFPAFKTDIIDKGDKFVLEADMPGLNKEDIDIKVDDNRLTISAKHKESREENKDNYIRKERKYGSFMRNFDVSNVKTEEIKASYKNGVLILELPKKHDNKSNTRRIDIH